LGVGEYREMGYLPEALRNYLLRLGWSHGDDEIISDADAIAWFDLNHLGSSPARFDFDKLNHINPHYMKLKTPEELLELLKLFLNSKLATRTSELLRAIPLYLPRVKPLKELTEQIRFAAARPPLDPKAREIAEKGKTLVAEFAGLLAAQSTWEVA